jgi:hypothetical protein
LRNAEWRKTIGAMTKKAVTASEIAEFVYCPEALRLTLLGHEPANQPVRDAGTTHHTRKARAERVAGDSIALGRWLVIAALILLGSAWLFS